MSGFVSKPPGPGRLQLTAWLAALHVSWVLMPLHILSLLDVIFSFLQGAFAGGDYCEGYGLQYRYGIG